MAESPSHRREAPEFVDNEPSGIHAMMLRILRDVVNVECVPPNCDIYAMTNQAETTAGKLKALCERAGITQKGLAIAAGYKTASGVQRFFNAELYGEKLLPIDFAAKVARVLAGRGNPPIQPEEVFALADISGLFIPIRGELYDRITAIAKRIVAETGIEPGRDQWARTVLELYLSALNTPDDDLEDHIRKDLVRKALKGPDA